MQIRWNFPFNHFVMAENVKHSIFYGWEENWKIEKYCNSQRFEKYVGCLKYQLQLQPYFIYAKLLHQNTWTLLELLSLLGRQHEMYFSYGLVTLQL